MEKGRATDGRKETRKPMLTKDPVCGAELEALETAVLASFDGELYAFCCYRCLNTFSENPEEYVRKAKSLACEPAEEPVDEPAPVAG
jgi:Cu+-exporting ATPase